MGQKTKEDQLSEWKEQVEKWKTVMAEKGQEITRPNEDDLHYLEEHLGTLKTSLTEVKTTAKKNVAVLEAQIKASWERVKERMQELADYV